jgi:steroid delta-isomerase-like uncharacterized protein
MSNPKQTLSSNKAVAQRLADEVFSQGSMRTFEEIFAEGYVNHTMPVPGIPSTRDGFRQVVLATRAAFPDVRADVKDIVAEGEFVVFRDEVHATSRGEFMGIPPTGRRGEWTEIHFLRIAGGRIVEHWANFDQVGILRQLGVLP